jgi:hypothetical protein
MAEFSREKAKIQEVYIRRLFPGPVEKYERQPYNLVTYDDNSGSYFEPVSELGISARTWGDVYTTASIPDELILDSGAPWSGVTEIR